ncbi:MAG: MarR family transcriptional regulator [Actinomycetia bacterium]|nr:MarR family transcriptional regulator [Actinomycetes bacterium]
MAMSVRAASEGQAACDLRLINSELHRVSLPAWLRLGLPMAQLKALVALASVEGVSVTGLAHSLSIGEPAASQLVEQLVRRGYAERVPDASDRRRVVVTATPVGAELVSELRQGRRQHIEQWLAAMQDDDVEALSRGLRALVDVAVGGNGQTCKEDVK